MSVVHNVSRKEYILQKKGYVICFHAMQELVAMGEPLVEYIPSNKNAMDLMMKFTSGQKIQYLVSKNFYDIYGGHQNE